MAENERGNVYSEQVKAGKRIYYFDVKETRSGDKFLTITESKKKVDGDALNPQFSFEKHKLFLYKEDYEKFLTALQNSINVAMSTSVSESLDAEDHSTSELPLENNTEEGELDINFDF